MFINFYHIDMIKNILPKSLNRVGRRDRLLLRVGFFHDEDPRLPTFQSSDSLAPFSTDSSSSAVDASSALDNSLRNKTY